MRRHVFPTTWLAFALSTLLVTGAVPASPGATIHGTVLVVDSSGKPLADPADVWVYLEDLHPHRGGPAPGAAVQETIKQHNQQFEPHVLVIPTGATISFPNLDGIEHSVFSPTDPPFNFGRSTDKTNKRRFDDPREVEIYCDIHKQMSARIKVIDSTRFVEVRAGHYAFEDVPAGTYRVVAWMPDSSEDKSDPIAIGQGTTASVAEIHLHPGPARSHRRHDNSDYPPY